MQVRLIPPVQQPGGRVQVIVVAQPHTRLHIEVQDLSFFQMLNLLPVQTDQSGQATWHFIVDSGYRANLLPIIIISHAGDANESKVLTDLQVDQSSGTLPLKFLAVPRIASPGGLVAVSVKTAPLARVRIEANGSGFAQACSLLERTADKSGIVAWQWQIPRNYPADVMPIIVTSDLQRAERKIVAQICVRHPSGMQAGGSSPAAPSMNNR
jgi:hypothetical protein